MTESFSYGFGSAWLNDPPVPLVRARETLSEFDSRMPTEHPFREADVRAALARVVARQRLERQLRAARSDLEHELGELEHRVLGRVPDVHRPAVVGFEQAQEPVDLVVDVAERPGLHTVAVDRDRPPVHR